MNFKLLCSQQCTILHIILLSYIKVNYKSQTLTESVHRKVKRHIVMAEEGNVSKKRRIIVEEEEEDGNLNLQVVHSGFHFSFSGMIFNR